ncbi:oligosaccharide flippase family protein [Rhodococcus aetherivorans]|uniref:oligosaccharide flippase family protein n=1 Tax=Rhodococcus aetherivorans TaxID=191292 RepID=UPI001376603E|nr:oligosaccharide flippase family protein [Rhodococcus aetherivorans]NGP28669.1 oligosaccharide flippase family protein [Rhodococcus aetherivorans]WFS15734.1 oligosaccharide flippase family protein [Rhodococcus aetherivorans]
MLDRPAGLVVTRIAGALLALLTSPLIARAIGPEGRGLTAAAMTTLMIVPIAMGLGLPWAVRQKAANSVDVNSIIRSARLVSAFSVIPSLAVGAILVYTLFANMPAGANAWLIAGLALTPLVVHRNSIVSALVVRSDFRRISCINIAQPIVFFVVILGLAFLSALTVTTVVAAQTVAIALGFLLTATFLPVSWRGPKYSIRSLVRESIAASGAQISEIASYRLNQLVLLPLIGSAALGFYAVAINVALAPAPVGQAISSAVFGDVARAVNTERRNKVILALQASCYLGVVIAVIISALSPVVIPWAFGSAFGPAVPATIVLAIGSVSVICNFVLTSSLIADGKSREASAAQFVGFAGGTVLLIALSMPFGLIGASIASAAGFWITSVVASKALGIGLLDWVPRRPAVRAAFSILFSRGK